MPSLEPHNSLVVAARQTIEAKVVYRERYREGGSSNRLR